MKPDKATLKQLFGAGTTFEVPFFQRSYVWGQEEWKRFLCDMHNLSSSKKEFFLGAIILKSLEEDDESVEASAYSIVDGQQRLTTLVLLLKVLSLKEKEAFFYNYDIDDEILEILGKNIYTDEQCLEFLRSSGVTLETERKLIVSNIKKNGKGALQPKFRKDLLDVYPKCIISEISMPEVLIAAHIKPVEYNGGYDASNGFLMRTDLHLLFDANHLKTKPTSDVVAEVEVDDITRKSYGFTIPSRILLPDYVSRENLRWRYENYKGVKMSSSI